MWRHVEADILINRKKEGKKVGRKREMCWEWETLEGVLKSGAAVGIW